MPHPLLTSLPAAAWSCQLEAVKQAVAAFSVGITYSQPCCFIYLQYVWKVCAVRPNEYKEIMEKMQTPEMQNLLKEAQDEIQHRKLSHFPAWQNIARRLSKLPLFEGLVYKAHHARFQGAGKASNVHQDPHLYAYRVVFRFPADGASVSHIDFHVGQRKANGTMKAGDYLATLAIPPGEVCPVHSVWRSAYCLVLAVLLPLLMLLTNIPNTCMQHHCYGPQAFHGR